MRSKILNKIDCTKFSNLNSEVTIVFLASSNNIEKTNHIDTSYLLNHRFHLNPTVLNVGITFPVNNF